jgi:hypothetical protein
MLKIVACLSILMLIGLSTHAQAGRDTIEIRKGGMGFRFMQNGRLMNDKAIRIALKTDPAAFKILHKSRTPQAISSGMAFAGGFIIGYEFASLIMQRPYEPALFAVGAGLVGVAIPIGKSAQKQQLKAIRRFNADAGKMVLHQ